MRKVKLIIERLDSLSPSTTKVIDVEPKKNTKETLEAAELIWLSDYINRNLCRTVRSVTEGKKIANVKIKSSFID